MNLTFVRYQERWILLAMDFLAFFLAYLLNYIIRFRSGLFDTPHSADYWIMAPALATSLYWMVLFALMGRYRPLYGMSRFDAVMETIKATGVGILIIFIALTLEALSLDYEPVMSSGKAALFTYWALLAILTGGGRVILRTVQHALIMRGIALSPALIVGFNERGKNLLEQTSRFPAMGYTVVGFIDDEESNGSYKGVRVLGATEDLPNLAARHNIQEALIALSRHNEDLMEKVIGICGRFGLRMKIMPELYHLVSGQVKAQGIYGIPLVEVFPDLMKPWEQQVKRLIDIAVSIIILIVNVPIMAVIAAAIKIDSPGSVIYTQKRVGKKGKEFTLYKFRSMIKDAEAKTGAVWAEKDDPRITRVGRFIRRTRLDELPQFLNVLLRQMSLVGPRPERKIFVDQFIEEIPLYSRRLNIKPGITGWAQVKHKYDESVEDVKVKLSHDLFYLDNISLKLDMKILIQTIAVMLRGKGQ